jgi:tRNA(adenine34) deaminase
MSQEFMKEALKEAKKALKKQEAPIGAVIVKDGRIIARGHNLRESKQDSTLHAEMVCIKKACKKLKSWRLEDCDIYVTLEPCPMCAGAILQSRIRNVYFGAFDPKAGAAGTLINILENDCFNHRVNVFGGILKEECASLLTDFFKELRQSKKN